MRRTFIAFRRHSLNIKQEKKKDDWVYLLFGLSPCIKQLALISLTHVFILIRRLVSKMSLIAHRSCFMNDVCCIEDAKDDDYEDKSFNKAECQYGGCERGGCCQSYLRDASWEGFPPAVAASPNQARPSSVFCFALSLSVLNLTNIIKCI